MRCVIIYTIKDFSGAVVGDFEEVEKQAVSRQLHAKDFSGAVARDFVLDARGVSHFHSLSFVLFFLSLLYFSLVFSLSKNQKIVI